MEEKPKVTEKRKHQIRRQQQQQEKLLTAEPGTVAQTQRKPDGKTATATAEQGDEFSMPSPRQRKEIENLWTDVNFSGSFSNLDYFIKALKEKKTLVGVTREQVKNVLEANLNYQTSRRLKKKFPRRKTIAYYFSERFEMDLGDLGRGRFRDISTGAEKGRFFLLCIDVFSRRFMVKALEDKGGASTLTAFKSILSSLKSPYTAPLAVECDQGVEFTNKSFANYLENEGIRMVVARGSNKARIAERGIRTFKKALVPYLEANPNVSWKEAVDNVTDRLNSGYNRSLGMSPNDVLGRWRELQQKYLAEDVHMPLDSYLKSQKEIAKGREVEEEKGRKFYIGKLVFRPYKSALLDKESDRQFSLHVYSVSHILNSRKPYLYKLADGKGDPVPGVYYAKELRDATEPEHYQVEKILETEKRRGKTYHLIRWRDYGKKFDEWVPASNIRF